MDPIHYIKNMLNIKEGGIVDTGVDIGLGAVPIIGKIYDGYRMHKLTVAMRRHDKQLLRIQEKIERKENEIFFKQEVFPLILNKLLNEEQLEKSPIIINGFEYVVDEDINEINTIYHFYDVLEELRLADIQYLAEEFKPRRVDDYTLGKLHYALENPEEFEKQNDFKSYMKNKLHRLGLIQYVKERKIDYNISSYNEPEEEWNLEKYELSRFGNRFITFFEEQ